MLYFPAVKTLLPALLAASLLAGCVAAEVRTPSPPGREALDALEKGMTRDAVIARLGRPTAAAQISTGRPGEFYESLTYADTVVAGAVVEIRFSPLLDQIRLDAKIYRDFSD